MNLTKILIETSERRVSKAPSRSALSLLKKKRKKKRKKRRKEERKKKRKEKKKEKKRRKKRKEERIEKIGPFVYECCSRF